MKAVIVDAPFQIRIGEWEEPRPAGREVLIAPVAVGICAGDMYFYLGKNPYAVYPQICGHEIAGAVVTTGKEVTDLPAGTPVVVDPFLGCGHCYPCRIGKSNCCVNLKILGVHIPGGYAEYVTAPAGHVHRVPEGLSTRSASFAEPVAIGVQACRRGRVGSEDRVLVLGCGPIGLALIEVARAQGAAVFACDIVAERLEIARRLGAETVIADSGLEQRVMEWSDGEGMPVVMEATGNPEVLTKASDLVAAGGRVVVLSLFKQDQMIPMSGLDFTRKELTIVGSRASVGSIPEALDLLNSGKISYPEISTEFDLWDAPQVFSRLAKNPGEVHKAVLVRRT